MLHGKIKYLVVAVGLSIFDYYFCTHEAKDFLANS
jgi:hypothetical protein